MFRTILAVAAVATLCACAPKATEGVSVSAPLKDAKVTSPMKVQGIAPSDWFAASVFPMELVVDGKVVATSPANPETDWQRKGQVPFNGSLIFYVTEETSAELVLHEDVAAAGEEKRSLRVPVVLIPQM